MNETPKRFAVCVKNEEHEESLELRKIYEILDDPAAEGHDMLRVIDEEREDYLYPRDWFLAIELPENVEQAILELTHH
jgi:hypothetical protein